MQDVPATPLTLAVLGDSIGYGTGARSAADALGPRLSAALTTEGFDVALHVLAVPGAQSRDLAPQVERARRLRPDLAVVVVLFIKEKALQTTSGSQRLAEEQAAAGTPPH